MNKSLYICAEIEHSKASWERKSGWSKRKRIKDKKARKIRLESEICEIREYWNHPTNLIIVRIIR